MAPPRSLTVSLWERVDAPGAARAGRPVYGYTTHGHGAGGCATLPEAILEGIRRIGQAGAGAPIVLRFHPLGGHLPATMILAPGSRGAGIADVAAREFTLYRERARSHLANEARDAGLARWRRRRDGQPEPE